MSDHPWETERWSFNRVGRIIEGILNNLLRAVYVKKWLLNRGGRMPMLEFMSMPTHYVGEMQES